MELSWVIAVLLAAMASFISNLGVTLQVRERERVEEEEEEEGGKGAAAAAAEPRLKGGSAGPHRRPFGRLISSLSVVCSHCSPFRNCITFALLRVMP